MIINLGTKKVYQGKDFFSLILPKVWIVNNNLSEGSEVQLIWDLENNTLIITPIEGDHDGQEIQQTLS